MGNVSIRYVRCDLVDLVRSILEVLLVLTSFAMVLLILMHKGRGGGLSDMFGGGVSTSLGGSSIAERNLTRITVSVALIWVTAVISIGLLVRFG